MPDGYALVEGCPTVGMGRVIGDGGWYFHVVDMAVLPDHQRRGPGDLILTALLDRIRRDAPAGAYVTLLADPPGRNLYAKHGSATPRPCPEGWHASSPGSCSAMPEMPGWEIQLR